MDKINNLSLKQNFRAVILTGTEKLLELPERKELVSADYLDQSDTHFYTTDSVKLKEKEVTLTFGILADNAQQFWTHYNAFIAQLLSPHWSTIYIDDHDKTYSVFYKKMSNTKKSSKKLKNVEKIFVKFDITFQVKVSDLLQ